MNDLENKTIHCHRRFTRKRLAGEKYRDSPKECISEKHDEQGYCRGSKYGETCSDHGDADCDVDLYCSDRKVCEPVKQDGEYCNTKEKCASYLVCAWEDGIEHKCRPYGYHPDGASLGPGDEDDICRSHYLNPNYICERGPSLTHSNLKDRPGEKCIYTHGDNDVSRCYYHKEGYAICRRGSAEMQSEWNTVLVIFSYLR